MNWLRKTVDPYLPRTDGPKVTDGEIAVFIVCVLVTTVGLAGDIARHLQNPESLENDFLSGWHLVLYGGVASVGAFIGLGAIRRGPSYVGAVGSGAIGFVMLAMGGVADATWHEIFGAEAAVEALVSPPHLLVFAEPYARQTGHLWWKTLSDPSLTLEFWSYVHGEFDDQFLSNIEDVDAAVEVLQRGQWPPLGWDASTTYRLRWLDSDESRRVSAGVFGLDLEAERRERKRLD